MSASTPMFDVIVVGGGPAGLRAMDRLLQAGCSVRLLEARDRVGGRVCSEATAADPDSYVDLGAQWLAETGQDALAELAERFQYETTKTFKSGNDVVWTASGDKQVVDDANGALSFWTKLDMLYIIMRFPQFADMDRPLRGNEAFEDMSVSDFVDQVGWTQSGKALALDTMQGAFCADTNTVGVFSAAYSSRSLGSMAAFSGADCYYFQAGLGNLLKDYAGTFAEHIQLSTEVKTIDHSSSPVVITTVSGEVFTAKQVVMAFPPQLLNRVEFTPPLANELQRSIDAQVLGQVVKLIAEYETPWWREKGFSGSVRSPNKFVHEVADVSSGTAGVLAAFITGPAAPAAAALPVEELQRQFEEFVHETFGSDGEPLKKLHFHNWIGDQHTLGAYASWPGVGIWKLHPNGYFHTEGPVHFAGTEYAKKWMGYIEGALQSGGEVAERIQKIFEATAAQEPKQVV